MHVCRRLNRWDSVSCERLVQGPFTKSVQSLSRYVALIRLKFVRLSTAAANCHYYRTHYNSSLNEKKKNVYTLIYIFIKSYSKSLRMRGYTLKLLFYYLIRLFFFYITWIQDISLLCFSLLRPYLSPFSTWNAYVCKSPASLGVFVVGISLEVCDRNNNFPQVILLPLFKYR